MVRTPFGRCFGPGIEPREPERGPDDPRFQNPKPVKASGYFTSRDGQIRIDLPPQPDGRSGRSRAESPSPSPLPQNRGLGFPSRRCRHCAREGSSRRLRGVHDTMGRSKKPGKPASKPAGSGGISGADLSLLLTGGVSELPDDQLAEIMQQLTLEQQKRSQKQAGPPTNPGPARPARRSSRSRSPKPKTKSRGHPLDAMNMALL
ncbi:hypothetical protein THAOC_13075 [Thalassiosira oceanica]|uniref:Uncharacterized protein n=1 Tax=Thalassiosira oceanica TaxID=159749 RepID=K0SL09_THAOC|nr:hypothetical protein THAOC_13075 [Thalassiosira oceanica]|eukprot:EJK66025.1 hypothetical protein THAOC_13075 [Thalassiosira oceanica]